jgi:hypothetical protein
VPRTRFGGEDLKAAAVEGATAVRKGRLPLEPPGRRADATRPLPQAIRVRNHLTQAAVRQVDAPPAAAIGPSLRTSKTPGTARPAPTPIGLVQSLRAAIF